MLNAPQSHNNIYQRGSTNLAFNSQHSNDIQIIEVWMSDNLLYFFCEHVGWGQLEWIATYQS